MNSFDHVIIIVHGTWGRGVFRKSEHASWAVENSPLRQHYRSALTGKLDYVIFNWSGANRVASREQASDSLFNLVTKICQENQGARIHLCTHSHAGNIAMMMLAKHEHLKISSLICLSTPFIIASKRNLLSKENKALFTAVVIYIAFNLLTILSRYSETYLEPKVGWIAIPTISILLVASILGAFFLLKPRLLIWEQYLSKRIENMRLNDRPPCPTFIVRNADDEAKLFLSFTLFINTIVSQIQYRVTPFLPNSFSELFDTRIRYTDNSESDYDKDAVEYWPWKPIRKLQRFHILNRFSPMSIFISIGLTVAIFVICAKALPYLILHNLSDVVLNLYLALFFIHFFSHLVILGLGLMFLFAIAPIIIVLELCRSILFFAFGMTPWLGLVSQVSVESTPPGAWEVTQIRNESKFKHSTHSDPESLKAVSTWLGFTERRSSSS